MKDAFGDLGAVVLGNVLYAVESPRDWLTLLREVGPTWTAVSWALGHTLYQWARAEGSSR